MADLVTHLASALIPGVALRPDRAVLLGLGAAIPDLAGRTPGIVSEALAFAGIVSPEWVPTLFGLAHQPIGGALVAGLLAWTLPEEERPAGAGLLVCGVLLHLALDVLQDHHGYGYFLLVPFDYGRYELGCMGSEDTVLLAPWLALLTGLVWGARLGWAWWRDRSTPAPPR